MATSDALLAHREFWLCRRDALREAASVVADLLGTRPADRAAKGGEIACRLSPAAAARLDQVTGGEPILRWAAVASAAALVLRRVDTGRTDNTIAETGGTAVLLTGAPISARLPVLLPAWSQARPDTTFREWLTAVVGATAETLDHDRFDETVVQSWLGDHVPIAIGTAQRGGADAAVTLELRPDRITAGSPVVPVELLEHLVHGVAAVLEQGLADPERPLRTFLPDPQDRRAHTGNRSQRRTDSADADPPDSPDGTDSAAEAAPVERTNEDGFLAPRTETQRFLAELWANHLGLDEVGIDEDFFALGGDSILGIRIVQEARASGYRLRPRHVLEFRTIKELAAVAEQADQAEQTNAPNTGLPSTDTTATASATAGTPPGVAPDVAPLAPAQHAFFARDLARHDHWNNSLRFPLRRPLLTDRVHEAVGQLARRHPALRTRFVPITAGARSLSQRIGDDPPPVVEIDLRDVTADEATDRMHDAATGLQRLLDLRHGPIGWFAVVRLPARLPDQLLIVLHHAVVDLYSWDVLTDELSTLLRNGDATVLPATTTSFPTWSRRLADHTAGHPDDFDVSYWSTRDWSVCVPVVPPGLRGRESGSVEVSTELGREDLRRLVAPLSDGGPTTYERLVAALGVAIGGWLSAGGPAGRAGERAAPSGLPVLLGGHGREDLFADVDLSRTVGWFTTTYPFLLPLPDGGGSDDLDDHTRLVAAELRAVPRNGLDFAAIRYLSTDPVLRERLAAVPTPQVSFDLTRAPAVRDAARAVDPLGPARTDATGQDRPAGAHRDFAVQIFTTLSWETLTITVRGSGELIPAERVDALARRYVREVLRCGR